MDLDSIISVVILLLFFILPNLLKFLAGKKKKTPVKQKRSVFGKIGEQVQKFIKDLEKQALQQEQQRKDQQIQEEDIWQALAESENNARTQQIRPEPEKEAPQPPPIDFEPPFETPEQIDGILATDVSPAMPKVSMDSPGTRPKDYQLRENPLQNAVVWSEILSKPLALRDR